MNDTFLLEKTVRRNLLRLEVYFEELNVKTMTEIPKYPVSKFIYHTFLRNMAVLNLDFTAELCYSC